MEGVRNHDQSAQRMIHAGEIFFEVPADLARRFQARQNVDEAKQRNPQRVVVERPVDHPPKQIFRFEKRRFVLRRSFIQGTRQGLDGSFSCVESFGHLSRMKFVFLMVIIIRSGERMKSTSVTEVKKRDEAKP
jgi:hypothetical protein